jgi:putative cardiolipin synthase
MMRASVYLRFVMLLLIFSGCATLPQDFERPQSYAITDTQETTLGRELLDEKTANPGQSGFHLLARGLDAFVARAVLAHLAERSIDVQYYLYHDDLVGHLFSYQLIQAADRGVRVRLLVDDMDLAGRDSDAAAMDSHPNIEVRIFNPFSRNVGRTSQFVTRMGSVTRRMHNKSFTVDSQVTIVGGRNIGNEYFDADPDLAFADLDVMAIGPAAQSVAAAFDLYWNSELAYPVSVLESKAPTAEEIQAKRLQLEDFVAQQRDGEYLQALRTSHLAEDIHEDRVVFKWGEAEVVYDQPEKILSDFGDKKFQLAPKLRPYVEGVDRELIIFSPYFVPGKEGTALLTHFARQGVRVRILTNSLASNDVSVVHSGYAKYRKDLLAGGVELYEMNKKLTREQRKDKKGVGGSSKASLHAKSFVFDREQVFIGSLNLDPRAVLHNTEIGMVFNQPEMAAAMSDWFDQNVDKIAFRVELVKNENGSESLRWHGLVDGKLQTFDKEPYTSFWQRFGAGFLRLLPIESQL